MCRCAKVSYMQLWGRTHSLISVNRVMKWHVNVRTVCPAAVCQSAGARLDALTDSRLTVLGDGVLLKLWAFPRLGATVHGCGAECSQQCTTFVRIIVVCNTASRSVRLTSLFLQDTKTVLNDYLCNKLFIIPQINQGKNEFSTVYSAAFHCQQAYIIACALTTAVRSVVDPCNIDNLRVV